MKSRLWGAGSLGGPGTARDVVAFSSVLPGVDLADSEAGAGLTRLKIREREREREKGRKGEKEREKGRERFDKKDHLLQ